MAGQIIVVSGTSGAGKSTACERIARQSEDFWLLFGIDHFLSTMFPAKFGHHGPRSEEGIQAVPLDPANPDGALRWRLGRHGRQALEAFHEWIAAASRAGCNIIVDHLLMSDPPLLQDMIWRLEGLPVLFVVLKPPYEVLLERVATRPNEKKVPAVEIHGHDGLARAVERLSRLRPWFYDAVYANKRCDLEIDTLAHDPDAVSAMIVARLAAGPGRAFDELRTRYPRP